jgi:hypothetical protein
LAGERAFKAPLACARKRSPAVGSVTGNCAAAAIVGPGRVAVSCAICAASTVGPARIVLPVFGS